MTVEQYIAQKKLIHETLLKYIDEGNENDYTKLIKLLNDLKTEESRNELKSTLQLIAAISNNHHRSSGFFSKIEKILTNYIASIKKFLSNTEIFQIFRKNQRILLYLYQNKLISDENLLDLDNEFIRYFYPEIKSKVDSSRLSKILEKHEKELTKLKQDEFDSKRLIGENDSHICQLIREDSIDEFIKYVNETNFQLDGHIESSIFETNYFLHEYYWHRWDDVTPTLIEYAFFFGSIQIVKYLNNNNVKLTPELWPLAIHSNDPEMIHLLEENGMIPPESYFITRENAYIPKRSGKNNINVWNFDTFKSCLVESIKCHHINIYNYIKDTTSEMNPESDMVNDYYSDRFTSDSRTDITFAIFKYFNYLCFNDDIENKLLFYNACKFDYASIVELLLKEKKVDVNDIIVF